MPQSQVRVSLVAPKPQHMLSSPLTARNGSCPTPVFDSVLKKCESCACSLHKELDFEECVGIEEKTSNK